MPIIRGPLAPYSSTNTYKTEGDTMDYTLFKLFPAILTCISCLYKCTYLQPLCLCHAHIILVPYCTMPMPYMHYNCTMPVPYNHACTIPAPCLYHTGAMCVSYLHHTRRHAPYRYLPLNISTASQTLYISSNFKKNIIAII